MRLNLKRTKSMLLTYLQVREKESLECWMENKQISTKASRALEEKRARLGLVECVTHDLLHPYPVLHEKNGEFVAHIKFTVLLMPNRSDRMTSHPLQELQSTKTIEDPEIKA
ncbi:ERBB-3 BINDING PROTEIN 1-like isoform X2 [Silene latifolia]|uniref:ERBB-3 BINDING PROTEIN 1-like isoform X2 n=1 Tax=Silene latifolia TaxID=37657 RepID=UPI003D777E89